jgi:integrase
LRWGDIDFESGQADVTRSIWRNVEGDTKTEVSRRPVPLHPIVVNALREWRKQSLYSSDGDFVFPSIEKNGAQPISPETILRRQIRPALKKLGITKQVGFHTFRHTLGTLLRQRGIDVKTAQELLRHANPRITMGIYQQAVSAERRAAQDRVVASLIPPGQLPYPSGPSEGS